MKKDPLMLEGLFCGVAFVYSVGGITIAIAITIATPDGIKTRHPLRKTSLRASGDLFSFGVLDTTSPNNGHVRK